MAGHSHWKNIKRDKDSDAKKRSLAFSKMGRLISLLAKEGGGDIEKNPALRSAIEKAKEINLPKSNIEKAIKKGLGELNSFSLEEFVFEAYGPGGVALIACGITDNKNRSIADFKKLIGQYGGKVAKSGSVKWMFNQKGLILIKCGTEIDEIELMAIDLGAEEVQRKNDSLKIFVEIEKTGKIKKALEEKGFQVDSFPVWIPKSVVDVGEKEKEEVKKMLEDLESSEDIQKIYCNIKECQ